MELERFRIIIEKSLLSYGFLSLLLVMETLQELEEYELCSVILNVLKEHSKKYNIVVPLKYNEDAIEEMKYNFMKYHNLSGEITEQNHKQYAIDILTEIRINLYL
jgi:hypothetical protein